MKEALWLACKAKTCCHTAIVVPSGRDVWRICRALDVPPWTFLRYFRANAGRPDAFRLDRSDAIYRLALAKQKTRRTSSPGPCIFLAKMRSGDRRCGLGDLRPGACRCFPSELVGGVLCLRNDAGCTCRTWDLADVDIAAETAKVQTRQLEAIEFHAVVAAWNASVNRAPEDSPRSFVDFCSFILESYDGLPAPKAP